jgi:RNA ligase
VEIKGPWSRTLSYCRGLIYDTNTLDVVGIPFFKFWNYETESRPETLRENLPKEEPVIWEKLDGSMIIGVFYKGKFIVATRGSFESDQAKWAQTWVNERIANGWCFDNSRLVSEYSYLFEVITHFDKKVVNYDFQGLVFLGGVNLRTATEFAPYECFCGMNNWLPGVFLPKKMEYEDLKKLQEKNLDNEEGFVACWYKKNGPAFRVKLKFERYQLLHRLYFQTTPETIWELVKSGEDILKHLEGADVNLLEWAVAEESTIRNLYEKLEKESSETFREGIEYVNSLYDLEASERDRKKAFAFYVTQRPNSDLTFLLYNGNLHKWKDLVWKKVKPDSEIRKGEYDKENNPAV